MSDVNLGNISIPVIAPQRGVDYWTESDKQEIVTEAVNSVNAIIEPQENTRQTNEMTRSTNEQNRVSNETTRQSNETTRQSNESTRQSNEQIRQNNETTRQSNEITRQTNETNRTNTFNAQMNNVQTAIQDINTSQTSFNANAEAKTMIFNDNATSKTTDFNTNATNKTTAFNDNAVTKIAEYDAHASEVSAQLEEECANLRNAMIEITGEGTNITLNKTSKNKFKKLIIQGNTEQGENPTFANPQTIHNIAGSLNLKIQNKNLFNIVGMLEYSGLTLPYTTTKNGVTFTFQKDGGIKVQGTATSNVQYYVFR